MESASVPSQVVNREHAVRIARRRRLLSEWQRLKSEGVTRSDAARQLGVGSGRLWKLEKLWEEHGEASFAMGYERCGRRKLYEPTEAELAAARALYLKLNDSRVRGRGLGSSKIAAFRMVARSDDARISEEFRAAVLGGKGRSVRRSWLRYLDAPRSVLQAARDSSSVRVTTPRGLQYIDADGEERVMRAGTLFESDDGTLNFPCCVPWPFGGDKCSDRYGVRLGRFQLLPVVDVRTRFCPAFHMVVRHASSYRGEDVMALFGDVFATVGIPEGLRLERGSWESAIVRECLGLVGVPVVNAWTSQQKAAVENFFDRLWTPLSAAPGDVGRFRGDKVDTTALQMACSAGQRDPRAHFPTLEQAKKIVAAAVQFINTETMESRGYEPWVPQQMWEAHLAERPLRRLAPELEIFFSREQRVWTVRGGLVGGTVDIGSAKFPVYFQSAELWEFEGCKLKVYFDPFAEPCLGTMVLQAEWRGYRTGHVVARDVPMLERAPQVVLALDGWADDGMRERQLAVRKAVAKAVRTETWNWLGRETSEARDGMGGVSRRVNGVGAAEAGTTDTRTVDGRTTNSLTVTGRLASRSRLADFEGDAADLLVGGESERERVMESEEEQFSAEALL